MTRSNPETRRRATGLLAMAGVAVACLGLPRGSAASPPPGACVCVVIGGPVPGLEPEALDAALSLEQRKRGITAERTEARRPEDCPSAEAGRARILLVVGPGEAALVIGPTGSSHPVDLGSIDRLDRARELARQAIGLVPEDGVRGPVPVVRGPLPRLPREAPARNRPTVAPRGYVLLGARYEYRSGTDAHAGGIDAEMGLSILAGRFEIGARAGWLRVGRPDGAAVPVTLDAVPVEIVARGGPRFGRVLLRLGVSAGIEWRRVEANGLPGRSRDEVRTDVAAAFGGEVEVAVDLVPGLRLAAAGTVRGFPGGTRYTWQGAPVLDAPKVAAGAALRLVVVFPRGAP